MIVFSLEVVSELYDGWIFWFGIRTGFGYAVRVSGMGRFLVGMYFVL